jgi:hypothetical protein
MSLVASAPLPTPSQTDDGAAGDPHPPATVRSPDPGVARQGPALREVGEPAGLEGPDILYEWGIGSFPASDPPSNW